MKQLLRQFRALRHNHSAHAALTGLVLFTIAMIAPPIQAQEEPPESEQIGYWSFDRYELNGTSSSTTESPSIWQWQTPQYESGYGILERARGYAPSAGSQAHISLSGAMSAVFKWYPADWGDYNTWYYYYAGYLQPKGDKLSALVRADARTFEVKYNNTNHVAENSLGTGVRETGNWEGESFANSTTPQNQTIPQSSEPYVPAGRIVSQTLLPSQTEVFIPAQFNVDASSDQSASGSIFFQATKDNRSVLLSRYCADTPKQKGASGVIIDEARDEWLDTDGTAHGHSIYAYDYERFVPDGVGVDGQPIYRLENGTEPNRQVFDAHRSGSWTEQWVTPPGGGQPLTWEWNPGTNTDIPDTIGRSYHFMPKGTHINVNGHWNPVPGAIAPSTFVKEYTLTDNMDGATPKPNMSCIFTMNGRIGA